ncbi:MAG: SPOR domain-containing protein [Acidobacteriaceae bacterium]|jgi:cell division septation protein DedD
MNHLLDTEEDIRAAASSDGEREISLGTSTILGIFFALALGAAAIFGAGYTMGRKSAQTVAPTPDTAAPSEAPLFGPAKPAAGSQTVDTAAQPAADTTSAGQSATAAAVSTVTVPLTPQKSAATPADGMIAGDKPPPPAPQPAAAVQQPATAFMVQVAAVSSQDVADILLASLEKKGYSVAVHHEPQDSLLHVQIGPFAHRPDAEAMRQRVLADGFNAIVK